MTGAEAITIYSYEHADELDRRAEIKERQAIEAQWEAIELRERAGRLRAAVAAAMLPRSDEQ